MHNFLCFRFSTKENTHIHEWAALVHGLAFEYVSLKLMLKMNIFICDGGMCMNIQKYWIQFFLSISMCSMFYVI